MNEAMTRYQYKRKVGMGGEERPTILERATLLENGIQRNKK